MPVDLKRMFSALVDDSDGSRLATSEQLRRQGDRRTRVKTTAVLLTLGLAVTGGLIGVKLLAPMPDGSNVVPGSTASPTVAVSPTAAPSPSTASPAVTAKKITNKAFLQPPDTGGTNESAELPGARVLPQLCAATFPSRTLVAERKTMKVLFWADNTPEGYVPDGSFEQTITRYKTGGGAQFMAELRTAVAGCATDTSGDRPTTYAVVAHGFAGDESIMISMTAAWPKDPVNDPQGPKVDETRLISVVRVGDTVTVLWETGWEEGSSMRDLVDVMTQRAVRRLNAWLNG